MNNLEEKCSQLEETIGYRFENRQLLLEALSHSSYINERKLNRYDCYERLEFLGDAVLELVTSSYLYDMCPDATEGELSKHRAALVCEKALASCARKIQLGSYILLGHGEMLNKGYDRDSVLCDVIEAVIGAVFKDSGFDKASAFILKYILAGDDTSHYNDYKTILQEWVAQQGNERIEYEQISVSGPDHDRVYEVCVRIGESIYGHGTATNRKEAERLAAGEALAVLDPQSYRK